LAPNGSAANGVELRFIHSTFSLDANGVAPLFFDANGVTHISLG
jgi:hypothetical protein